MRLAHVTVLVSDLSRSRDFYARLGWERIVETPHYCRFATQGGATLSIQRHDGPIAPCAEIGIEFESAAALDAEVARLQAAGFTFLNAPTDRAWLWRDAKLADPDGHVLLYFFAGENKLNPPWRVRT